MKKANGVHEKKYYPIRVVLRDFEKLPRVSHFSSSSFPILAVRILRSVKGYKVTYETADRDFEAVPALFLLFREAEPLGFTRRLIDGDSHGGTSSPTRIRRLFYYISSTLFFSFLFVIRIFLPGAKRVKFNRRFLPERKGETRVMAGFTSIYFFITAITRSYGSA